jgi:hypothetical protein
MSALPRVPTGLGDPRARHRYLPEGVELRPAPGLPGILLGADRTAWSCRVRGRPRAFPSLLVDWHEVAVRTAPGGRMRYLVLRPGGGGKVAWIAFDPLWDAAFASAAPSF